MPRLRLVRVLVLPLMATACAAIVDFPSLPNPPDSGTDATVPDGSIDTTAPPDGAAPDSQAADVAADSTVVDSFPSEDGPVGDSATDTIVVDTSMSDEGEAGGDSGTADTGCAIQCDGGCASPTDLLNCGTCGNNCTLLPNVSASGLACASGVCEYTCQSGFEECNSIGMGCATNITVATSCGSCSVACSGSTPFCTEDDAGTYGCTFMCPGQTNCGGTCADTQTNPSYCGASCTTCPSVANGTPVCNAGTCGAECSAGYAACGGGTPCQYNTQADPTHCGTACTMCPAVSNGTATCTGGECGGTCSLGYSACGGATPCAFDTTSDPGHCGSSCNQCPTPANGNAACNASTCGVSCATPYSACGGTTACYNTNTDPDHCGSACSVCSSGQCLSGQCAPSLVWGADVSDTSATGMYPSVAVGTSSLYGAWAVQVDQAPYVSGSGPNLTWQAGSSTSPGALASPTAYTFGWQPSIASLSSTGQIAAVHDAAGSMNAPESGTLYWFSGYLTSATAMSWPNGTSYGSGFRPRIAAVQSSGAPTSALEVHMGQMAAGPLWYVSVFGPTGSGGAHGLYFQNSGIEYDTGTSQNPDVALGPSSGSSAALVEVHNDSSGTALYYRVGTLTLGTAAAAPTYVGTYPVPSLGSAVAFGTGGAHPAIALFQHPVYGLVAVEVHEANGGLYAAVGLVSASTITWFPAVQVDASGTLPSIAIDPATGLGLAAHQSATAGTIVENTFTIH